MMFALRNGPIQTNVDRCRANIFDQGWSASGRIRAKLAAIRRVQTRQTCSRGMLEHCFGILSYARVAQVLVDLKKRSWSTHRPRHQRPLWASLLRPAGRQQHGSPLPLLKPPALRPRRCRLQRRAARRRVPSGLLLLRGSGPPERRAELQGGCLSVGCLACVRATLRMTLTAPLSRLPRSGTAQAPLERRSSAPPLACRSRPSGLGFG